MDIVNILLLVIGGLVGMVFYNKTKRESAEALNDNAATKEQLNELDRQKAKNDGLLDVEAQTRATIEASMKEEAEASKNLLDFFNKDKK